MGYVVACVRSIVPNPRRAAGLEKASIVLMGTGFALVLFLRFAMLLLLYFALVSENTDSSRADTRSSMLNPYG